jgi:MFS family permease
LLADKLEQRQPWADELLGWIMLAFAVAIVLLGLFEDHYDRREMFQAAIIPAIIGVVVLAYCRLVAPRARPAPPPSS